MVFSLRKLITESDEFVNLTGKVLALYDEYGNMHKELDPAGVAPTLADNARIPAIDGVPCFGDNPMNVENLLPPMEGKFYIVQPEIKAACPDRHDLVTPGRPLFETDGTLKGYLGITMWPGARSRVPKHQFADLRVTRPGATRII